ncbi:MAG: hypothetical protein ASARMPREDX12_007174 [Alectoria sarmentosa]|nr:MAG: hypothetical protein ASARMPREDX12_007174 [Alectoria sarmentosa]
MTSSPTNATALGNAHHRGALFTLPRELRDEIYRFVVKGSYLIRVRNGKAYTTAVNIRESDFGIFKVSKAISQEASDIYYSESDFLFVIDFCHRKMIRLPTKLTDRMKNVKLILTDTSILRLVRRSITFDRIKTICNAGIVPFTSAHIPRNTLGIELICDGPYTIDMLRIHLFETFKAMTGFRTVTIEISKDLSFRTESVMMTEKEFEELIFQMLAGISQELKKTLEPTLGPAIEETRRAVWYLTFHPREHMVNSAA